MILILGGQIVTERGNQWKGCVPARRRCHKKSYLAIFAMVEVVL